jgi:hypothetical protein
VSVQQILLATLIASVIVAGGTLILVVYTPFGKDLWRIAVAGLVKAKRGIGIAFQAVLASFRNRRPFWVALLLVIASWTLAGFVLGDLSLEHVTLARIVLLAFAATMSGGALVLAFTQQRSRPVPTVSKEVVEPIAVPQSADDAKALRVEKIRLQLYAATAAIHKYADPDGHYTDWDQLKPINALIYRLLGEGEDLTAFLVPTEWEEGSGYVEDRKLVPRLEGLLICLK